MQAFAHEHAAEVDMASFDGRLVSLGGALDSETAERFVGTAYGIAVTARWADHELDRQGIDTMVQQGAWTRREKSASLSPPRWRRAHVLWVSPVPLAPWGRYPAEEMETRVRAGQRVKAVPADTVRPLETTRPLPELDVYASGTLLMHRSTGVGAGADLIHLHDQHLARALIRVIRALMDSGEPLRTFVPCALRGTPHHPLAARHNSRPQLAGPPAR